jgi:hypothetical protein
VAVVVAAARHRDVGGSLAAARRWRQRGIETARRSLAAVWRRRQRQRRWRQRDCTTSPSRRRSPLPSPRPSPAAVALSEVLPSDNIPPPFFS